LCPSQTIKLVTIPIPGVTWDWSNGFASISSDPFANVSVAATYTVTAKGENGACSVISAPLIIQSGAGSLPADPVITTNAPICAGTTLTLSTPIVSGASYKWAGPNNFTSSLSNISIPSATIANAGIYSLTVKVGDCSSNTVTKRVDIVTSGSFSISSSVAGNTICQGQSLTLTVNSETGYSYQWLKDNVNMSGKTSPTLTVTEGGSYKVNVSNTAIGCSQETSPVSVVVYTAPVASFTLDASGCIGTLINFSNISVTDTKVTSVTYLWEFGDNTTSTDEDPTHTYSTAQTYNPKLTIGYSGVSGCTSSVTKSITIATGTPPVITALNTELCNNGTEKSRLSVSGNFSSYKWSTGEETPNIDVTSPGEYTVDTVEPNGCKGFDTFTITEKTDCNTQNPLVFTPNGDSQNDFWILPGIENKQDCTMNIFDGRGRKILEKKGFPVGGWDGVSDEGKAVPDGTYYYVFSCPDQTPETGSVLIVR
jgi:gliding motility-associated-like protein